MTVHIRQLLTIGPRERAGLADVLIACVEAGASVSFMQPMTRAKADAFWDKVGISLAAGEGLVFVAEEAGRIVGTVQVILAQPENQPHRGELAKMLVSPEARKRGIGNLLMIAAEEGARAAGKTLLVLDTASDDAERLYERNGWQRLGAIPDYALWPDGGLCATAFYFKPLR